MSGVLRVLGKARATVVLVALMTSLALLAGVVGEAAAAVRPKLSEDGEKRRPKTQQTTRVKGRTLKAAQEKLPGQAGTPVGKERPKPVWPEAAEATADLSHIKPSARSAAPWVQAGKLPVWLTESAARPGERTAPSAVPPRVRVRLAEHKTAKQARTDGLMLALSAERDGRAKVGVNYSDFASAHGGDWASRLRLVKLPACALTTPTKTECQKSTPLPTVNDPKRATLAADVDVAANGARSADASLTILAIQAGSSGAGGDWGATNLSPASTWSAGSNTGEFSWSYPVRMPPVPGNLLPQVTIGYNSGAVDGKTAADNSQASWLGDGFDYWPGFVERKYKPCMDDGRVSGDLCWGRQNAVLSLNGRSTELLYDSGTKTWRPRNDDGSTVERLTGASNGDDDGEWWRVTTLEGVQYIFGKDRPDDWSSGKDETNSAWTVPVFGDDSGEPCHKDAFKDAWCNQAWRWNLDHVIDPHKNTITYFYGKETNNYTRVEQTSGGTKYVSGGHLTRIDYGQRQGSTFASKPTARVRFGLADRTDIPDDQICKDGETCGFKRVSPTFFDRKRLTKITTKLRNDQTAAVEDPGYDLVDVYDFGQTYQNGALWLHTIDQTGKYGTDAKASTVTLTGQLMPNRVVTGRSGTGVDALPGYERPRLVGVSNGTGSTTTVGYSDPYVTPTPPAECIYSAGNMPDPKSNPKRCFPVKWQDPNGKIVDDWYHKYVASYIIESDATGQSRSKITDYTYLGGAAWRYAEDDGLTKDKWRHWSQWRGYSKVRTVAGDGQNGEAQSRTETTYARGMDGNYQGKGVTPDSVSINDSKKLLGTAGIKDTDTLAGAVIESRTFNGAFTDEAETSATVSLPKWVSTVSRTFRDTNSDDDITVHGGWVKPTWTKARSRKADGNDRYTETYYDYDDLGRAIAVDDEGDPATANDDTCSRTVFPSGAATGVVIRTLPIRALSVSVDCDNETSHEPNLAAGDMISDIKTIYDSGSYGDYPTLGNDRQIETVKGVADGRSTMAVTTTNVHDRYGRVTSTTQPGDPSTTADDRTTTSTYNDAPEGWLKSSLVKLPPVNMNGTSTSLTTTTEFNPARGVPTRVVDPNGRDTDAEYDGLGRIIRAWSPDNYREGSPDRPSTTYTYAFPADGNPVSITTKTLRKADPVTYDTSVEIMDGLLRPRQTQVEAPGGGRMVSDTKYDSRGLVFKANAPYLMSGAPSGVLTSADDNQIPSQTISTYDGLGRPLTATLYNKSTKKWTSSNQYQGERSIAIPPAGAMPTMSITDARGRVVESRQYKGTDLSGAYVASTNSFDAAGRPHEARDAAGNVWKTNYDVQGRPVTSSDPDKGTSSVTYDHFDQVATTKDARGTTLTHSYDKLGRPIEVKNGASPLTSYTYDTVPYAKGLPATATRHIGADRYVSAVTGYDALYRAMGSSITIPSSEGALAGTYSTNQDYNFDGTPASTDYPAVGGSTGLPEETVKTHYNADGLPDWTNGLATYVAGTKYDSHGEVTQLESAAVDNQFIWQTFDRDEATQRLTRATVKRQTSPATYDVETKYGYTPSGSLNSIRTNTVGKLPDQQCFTYDYAQRLTQAWSTNATDCPTAPAADSVGGPAPYWTSYEYDANGEKTGNRTKEVQHAFTGGPATDKTRTYTYPAALGDSGTNSPHGLKSVTETEGTSTRTDLYTYDQAGNTTTRPGQKLTWDAEGHLAKVSDTSDKELASFIYDAGGNRLIRKDSTGKTLYLPSQELKLSTNGNLSAVRYYSHGGDTVAYRTGRSTDSVQFLTPDYQGSPSTTINAADQNTWSLRRFGPFGNERSNAIGIWPTVMDKGYVGGTKDASTGLTHLGAREYDPSIGRFISVDPIFAGGDPQTWNGFAYAANNPVGNSDPDGLQCRYMDGMVTCTGGASGHPDEGKRISGTSTYNGPSTTVGEAGYRPPPTPPAPPPCTSWTCKFKKKAGGFVKKHAATIAATAVGVGCGVAVGWTGVGAVGCAAAAGAVYGAVNYAQHTPQDQWKAGGFLTASAKGAAIGVVTHIGGGLALKAAAPIVKRVAPKIASKIQGSGAPRSGSKAPPAKAKAAPASSKKTTSAAGGGCKGNSFVPGTAVLMANGAPKPIDKIKVGDKVLATDPQTGKTSPQTVLTTYSSTGTKALVQVTVDTDGKQGTKTGKVVATDDHPFYLPTTNQWVDAGQLKPGMWLRTSAGAYVQVAATKTWTKYTRAHNLSVDTARTYYVLADRTPALVHNCNQLAQRASEIHSAAGSPRAMQHTTVAVVRAETPQGVVDVVAGSGRGLNRAQEGMLRQGEIAAENIPDTHAEQNALLFINSMGWNPIAGAASRSVCSETCAPLIRATGGRITGTVYPRESGTKVRTFEW
ncbi:polymorphic toxin-type HINT domain-containing protein [Spirillospora sp. CA-294931]|uniref:polymorphic toxin-type HINT domain-containing protein n=1 Tax=Spirillospora sp. CA-294931 TaxID=3240042 RepID=UPI003D943B2C